MEQVGDRDWLLSVQPSAAVFTAFVCCSLSSWRYVCVCVYVFAVPCAAQGGLGIFCVSASKDFGRSFVDPVFVDPVLL